MSNPMPEKPLGLPSFDLGPSTAKGDISLGFGIEGTLPLSAEGISGYINGLAQTNPAKFANILKAVEATGIKVNDFTDVGTAIGRLVTNMKTDENSPIKSMTVETFLNSVNTNFKFGKAVQPKGPTEQFYFTSPEAAGAELDAEFTKVLGVNATDAEKAAFYKKIKKAQESKPSVTTSKAGKGGKPGKVVQTQGFSAEEKDALINEFVAVRAKGAIGTTQEAAPATVDASGQISYGKVKTKYDPLAGEKFGIESISRGAVEAVLIEKDLRAADTLHSNVANFGIKNARVVIADAFNEVAQKSGRGSFDVVFIDPPYSFEDEQVNILIGHLAKNDWLNEYAVIVVERGSRSQVIWPESVEELRKKVYGDTTIWYGQYLNSDQ